MDKKSENDEGNENNSSDFENISINNEGDHESVNGHYQRQQTSQSGVIIAWKDVSVFVPEWTTHLNRKSSGFLRTLPVVKRQRKIILNRLTGHFLSGSLNGLLGPSGAGKTSLLNVLSGSTSSTEGSVLCSSETEVYYISQCLDECIVGELTVGQLLGYAYQFKNSACKGQRSPKMEEHIQATMALLMLPEELLDRPFHRCSGGEQKRVAIAQELMSRGEEVKRGQKRAQKLLFLDEPTTGLDSASAHQVMAHLEQLTRSASQITIVASIHAPSDEVLRLFSKLYVLAKGGVAVYSGPPAAIRATLEGTIEATISTHQPPVEALLRVACDGE